MPVLCPGLELDRAALKVALLAEPWPADAAAWIPRLDEHPELQGLARLAAQDRSSQALPAELPDPATALLTPIDDRVLSAVELAHAQLSAPLPAPPADAGAPGSPASDDPVASDKQRTRAHAYLAQVYGQALQSLGLTPGRPLPPFARLLAAHYLHHGRSFCRFYWQRRVAGLERLFAETELHLLELSIDLDNTPHLGDGGLLAVERQRTRLYLQRKGPRSRIAAQARRRPEARAMGTELLLPLAQELARLLDHQLTAMALDRAVTQGASAGGPGLDPVVAALTEELRERDLREFERRLTRRMDRARRGLSSARERGTGVLEPELPMEWINAATLAEDALAWLTVADRAVVDQGAPSFARRHALARAVLLLRARPDGLRELLALGPEDPVISKHRRLLAELLAACDGQSLSALRTSEALARPGDRSIDDATRRRYALATRDALLHPR